MSLDGPTIFEKVLAWLKTPGKLKLVGILVGICAVILLVLFTVDRCGDWRSNRDIDKRKANINAGLANIANKEGTIANLQTEIAVEKERVKESVKEHLEAVNATEAARTETNKALSNLDNARNSNTTNSSVETLEQLLERLK